MAKTPKPARNHHWVSQCYLKQFATPAEKDGLLWVYDFVRGKSFKTKPRGVAAQNDFNRIDIPGQPIDAVEKAMAEFEAGVDKAIRETIAGTDHFPSSEARDYILSFIALLAVRNPVFRETRRAFKQRVSESIMNLVLQSPEMYQAQMEKALAAGAIEKILPYEEMKDFHRRKEYTFEVGREGQIQEEFKLQDVILKVIGRRPWTVIRASPGAGEFITCDHPVMLRPSGPEASSRPLGFGQRGASVVFPLSKHVLLLSDADTPEQMLPADQMMVAAFNREVVLAAEPQLYAADDTFVFFDPMTDEAKTGAELSVASRPPVDEASTKDTEEYDETWDLIEPVHQSDDQTDAPQKDGQ